MACSAPDVVVVHEPSVERSDRADKRLRAPPVVLRALSRAAATTTGSSSSSGGGGGDLHVVSASCCLLTCEQTEYSLSSLSSVRCVSRCACPVCPEPVLVKCSFLASIDIRAVTKPTPRPLPPAAIKTEAGFSPALACARSSDAFCRSVVSCAVSSACKATHLSF